MSIWLYYVWTCIGNVEYNKWKFMTFYGYRFEALLGVFLWDLLSGVFLTAINFAHVSGQAFLLLGDTMQSSLHSFIRLNNFYLGVCLILKASSIPGSHSKLAVKVSAKTCVYGLLLIGEQTVNFRVVGFSVVVSSSFVVFPGTEQILTLNGCCDLRIQCGVVK